MTLYLGAFALCLVLGVPIAFSLGLASLVYLLATGHAMLLMAFPQKIIAGIDNFVLLTIPFFILAGNLMNAAKLTQQIVRLAQLMVGRVQGGLAAVTVVASMLFSGVSGAATAEASALGSMMIPAMRRDGYAPAYAAALTAAGSLLGPLVPPSLALILYGVLTGTSIGDLFLAGIVPAVLLCGLLVAYTLWKARREDHPLPPPLPAEARRGVAARALPALLLPVIIVGGIRSGVFTPTEAAAVAAVYALLIGTVFYRTLSLAQIREAFFETATLSAGVMLVVAMASMTSFILGIENIPQAIARAVLGFTQSPALLVVVLNVVLLVLGFFLEPLAALVLAMPILNQLAPITGLDPVQFGVMVVFNLMIGMITPPVGLCLFIVSAIGRVPIDKVSRAALPMIGLCILVLLLVGFVPQLSLLLPSLFHR
ncbi:TRAP transporter, DctM subunit [Tistlia consotensis]|uniref:TRAP transporter large permease protein n=1 Tax=Tistlia consotensis USBA 355 TaxID=560819 RepID=A0A1Y6B8P0_9PROT|nr:TRAP transporter large permease [Tistlia consotensis]SME98648.1 TRAP transporter, DctM subunit [Tistlia consotensis USBA 355]SNR58033.1 TRAP transporter, DctM subunit [Tistlia consotensis]